MTYDIADLQVRLEHPEPRRRQLQRPAVCRACAGQVGHEGLLQRGLCPDCRGDEQPHPRRRQAVAEELPAVRGLDPAYLRRLTTAA